MIALLCFTLLGQCTKVPYGKQELIQNQNQVTRITYPQTSYPILNEGILEEVNRCRLSFHLSSQERQFSYTQYEEGIYLSFLFTCYEFTTQEYLSYSALTFDIENKELVPVSKMGVTDNRIIGNEHFYLNREQLFIPAQEALIQIPRTTLTSFDEIPQVSSSNKPDPNKPMIALTFDDGPNSRYTPQILDILAKSHVVATFFVIGQQISAHEDVIRKMIEGGNQIGIHTFTHRNLTKLKDSTIQEEISKTKNLLLDLGYTSTIVRPPYGAYNSHIVSLIKEPLVLWTIDTRDWESLNTERIVKSVKEKVKNGDIILFHDMYPTTVKAVEILVPYLIKEGYQLVSVDDMIRNCPSSCVKD